MQAGYNSNTESKGLFGWEVRAEGVALYLAGDRELV